LKICVAYSPTVGVSSLSPHLSLLPSPAVWAHLFFLPLSQRVTGFAPIGLPLWSPSPPTFGLFCDSAQLVSFRLFLLPNPEIETPSYGRGSASGCQCCTSCEFFFRSILICPSGQNEFFLSPHILSERVDGVPPPPAVFFFYQGRPFFFRFLLWSLLPPQTNVRIRDDSSCFLPWLLFLSLTDLKVRSRWCCPPNPPRVASVASIIASRKPL